MMMTVPCSNLIIPSASGWFWSGFNGYLNTYDDKVLVKMMVMLMVRMVMILRMVMMMMLMMMLMMMMMMMMMIFLGWIHSRFQKVFGVGSAPYYYFRRSDR